MPHDRPRHVSELFDKLMSFSPIVGMFGHRQVGKSTFITSCIDDYRTLDDLDQLELAQSAPKKFIQPKSLAPVAIDECQMEPRLFPTLKERVRTHKRPGQFVLSGSVRFTSRKVIRESLAGRISVVELLPFSIAETIGEPLSNACVRLFGQHAFSEESVRVLNPAPKRAKVRKYLDVYLEQGGLPGLCFIRSPEIRRRSLIELHDLILARDLRLVSELKTPVTTMKKLLSYIARNSFEPYNAADVRRTLGLAPQTQKNLLFAMESVFLIRRIPIPLRKKEIIVLEDQLEELIYSGGLLQRRKQLEGAVFRNLRTQFNYRLDHTVVYESYLTRDHARVPLVIGSQGGDEERKLGLIICEDEKPSLSESRSANSFLRRFGSGKIIYLSPRTIDSRILDGRTLSCSIDSIL